MKFMDLLRSACTKNLKNLTAEEFLTVAAWHEFLRYGGDDPRS